MKPHPLPLVPWMPFLCSSCALPCWNGICTQCLHSIQINHELIFSQSSEIIALAPLLFAFQSTYQLIRRWKEKRGTLLRSELFKMSLELKLMLKQLDFDFIIPIPQAPTRSHHREHRSAYEVSHFYAQELQLPIFEMLALQETTPIRLSSLNAWDRTYAPNPFRICENLFIKNPVQIQKLEASVMNGSPIQLLLIDDLITSGSTLTKASEVIHQLLPRAKIYGGALGYRPALKQ